MKEKQRIANAAAESRVNSIRMHFEAVVRRRTAEIDNVIYNMVGIGEHVRFTDDLISLFVELDAAKSQLATVNEYAELDGITH